MSPSQSDDGTAAGRVRALIRKAAGAYATGGWRASPGGLIYQAADGPWGRVHIDVEQGDSSDWLRAGKAKLLGSVREARTPIRLTAGASSPYLLRIVNRLDPAKPPPVGYLHTWLLWQVRIEYGSRAHSETPPLAVPQPIWAEPGVILGPDTALTWFNDLFRTLVPAVTVLCSERAIRDRLVATAGTTDFLSLRYAALLTRHLGLGGELPGIVERAASASTAFDAFQAQAGGQVVRDDNDPNMMMWTHDRFVRFLSSAPP